MRMAITILSFARAVGIASCQCAIAVAIDAPAMKEAASAASTIQPARFYGHATRHYVVKCYRELVVGQYECRRFYRWGAWAVTAWATHGAAADSLCEIHGSRRQAQEFSDKRDR
jgi:hypothetical protein